MPSSSNPVVLIGEIAAVVSVILLVCLGLDTLAELVGYHPRLFCTGLDYAIASAHNVGSICAMLGVVFWALSRFKSDTGLGLILGGFLLALYPTLLPHYLEVSCLP